MANSNVRVTLQKNMKGSVLLIVKPREIPTHILQIEALNRRLSPHHRNKELARNQARNLRTGFNGEKSLDFTLSFLPDDAFQILHNLRIQDSNGFFQMDTLLISAYFVLIIEVKNIYGTITFDGMGQAIRTRDDGIEEGFSNPVEQVLLQERRFRKWLRLQGIPPSPLEKLVVYSNSNTILKNITNNRIIADTVIHKGKLLSKIEEYSSRHRSQSLSGTQLDKLSNQLIMAHTAESINVLEKYKVSTGQLLCGVICPDCGTIPMLRRKGRWECQGCGCISKNAHLDALEDYRLLISNTIKNQQAREFLGLDSTNVAKQLLQGSQLNFTGNTSARQYILSLK